MMKGYKSQSHQPFQNYVACDCQADIAVPQLLHKLSNSEHLKNISPLPMAYDWNEDEK